MYNVNYWIDLYEKHKKESLCIDIEGDGNRNTSVIGIYVPKDGEIEALSFIRGQNLTIENLKPHFHKAKMLIAFNGFAFDIPQIKKEFPGVIPEGIKVFDPYLFAKNIGINTNLKVLETTFGIDRMDEFSKRRRIATRLWKKYKKFNDENALAKLIEYNRQDTINLYPLAEELIRIARSRKE